MLPDAERRQWILDRRVVEELRESGDVASIARPVDHWVYFASAAARRAFLADAAREGFARASVSKRGKGASPYAAHVRRVDTVELDQVHAAVMSLFAIAERHDGEYDGWETSVERKPAKMASKKKTS